MFKVILITFVKISNFSQLYTMIFFVFFYLKQHFTTYFEYYCLKIHMPMITISCL